MATLVESNTGVGDEQALLDAAAAFDDVSQWDSTGRLCTVFAAGVGYGCKGVELLAYLKSILVPGVRGGRERGCWLVKPCLGQKRV